MPSRRTKRGLDSCGGTTAVNNNIEISSRHYTEVTISSNCKHAAILELQRFANIIALNGIHRTVKDTFIGSIPIPADTLVLGQIYNVMANSPVYPAPEKFMPERFLMNDGVTPNKEAIEQFCPFSIGKRMCVGEGMAKMELFIGLITIVQNFKIEPVKGREIDLEPILATVMRPKPQLLRIVPI